MKLFEEFKEYETLWEDSATEPNKKEYLISYEDKVFNLATEEGLQSYITLRAPKLGKKKVRVELKQIIGHDKEPTSREYIEAKNELIDIAGKLEAVGALFKVPLQDAQSTGIFYKMRRRLHELDDSFKPQYEAARLKLLNVVESTNGKTKTSKTSHSTESSCMWTTPDGRQIDLNNPTVVAEEIDHLIQVTEQDYISYNNKRVASGKPAKDFSKLLKSQRDVLVHEFNHLRDAIIAPSTVVDKKAAAEEELNRYYYAYDTGALVPKTVHEEFKLFEEMWEDQAELKENNNAALNFEDCKNTLDVFKVWAQRLGYSKGNYPYEFMYHAFTMGTEGREIDDEWYDIQDDFEPWGVWSDLQTINEAGLDYHGMGFEKALQAQAEYDKEKLGKQS